MPIGLPLALICIVLLGWLTWYVCVWLLVSCVVLGGIRALRGPRDAKGAAEAVPRSLSVKLVDGFYEVVVNLTIGLGIVTAVQFVINLCAWLGGDATMLSSKVYDWLWGSEDRVAALRETLVSLMHPRITLPLLVATVLVSVVQPKWKLVERVFVARSRVDRILQVVTVIASVTFFGSEYASRHEQGFVESRVAILDRERAEGKAEEMRVAAAKWMLQSVQTANPAQKDVYAQYLRAVADKTYGADVLLREKARFESMWRGDPVAAASKGTADDATSSGDANDGATEGDRSVIISALEAVAGPSEPSPTRADVKTADDAVEQARERARQARAAVVEAVKLAVGGAMPSAVEGIVELFVTAVTDAAAETFVPRWLERIHRGAKGTDDAIEKLDAEIQGTAPVGPDLYLSLATEQATSSLDPTSDANDATAAIARVRARVADDEKTSEARREGSSVAEGATEFGRKFPAQDDSPLAPRPPGRTGFAGKAPWDLSGRTPSIDDVTTEHHYPPHIDPVPRPRDRPERARPHEFIP